MVFSAIGRFFATEPHIERLPEEEVRRQYPKYRMRVMESTFIGYAMFYLVRNNVSVVTKDLEHVLHYNDQMLGNILAITAISYGIGKFFMGAASDRSNPRKFMAAGLLATGLCNLAFGWIPSYYMHLFLWGLNGLFQGMGWPPCGRSMGHWYSEKERGLTFSIWNTSHNVGGGLAGVLAAWSVSHIGGWQYAFIIPGVLSIAGAVYAYIRLVDTPQSVGLPPIEEFKADGSGVKQSEEAERELTWKELFLDNVLLNRLVWLLAIANFFAYISRYSMLDWGPKYLQEVKGATRGHGGLAVLALEFGGIPSTILLGWVSDLAKGRRGMVATICMVPIIVAFTTILLTPPGHLWLDMTMLVIVGLCIYPVINFIVIMALDATSKKAIGAAAGFIGLMGYLGRTALDTVFGGMLKHYKQVYSIEQAWDLVLYSIVGCTVIAFIMLAFTWNLRPKSHLVAAKQPAPSDKETEPVASAQ